MEATTLLTHQRRWKPHRYSHQGRTSGLIKTTPWRLEHRLGHRLYPSTFHVIPVQYSSTGWEGRTSCGRCFLAFIEVISEPFLVGAPGTTWLNWGYLGIPHRRLPFQRHQPHSSATKLHPVCYAHAYVCPQPPTHPPPHPPTHPPPSSFVYDNNNHKTHSPNPHPKPQTLNPKPSDPNQHLSLVCTLPSKLPPTPPQPPNQTLSRHHFQTLNPKP
jgi:hypothetical protein